MVNSSILRHAFGRYQAYDKSSLIVEHCKKYERPTEEVEKMMMKKRNNVLLIRRMKRHILPFPVHKGPSRCMVEVCGAIRAVLEGSTGLDTEQTIERDFEWHTARKEAAQAAKEAKDKEKIGYKKDGLFGLIPVKETVLKSLRFYIVFSLLVTLL